MFLNHQLINFCKVNKSCVFKESSFTGNKPRIFVSNIYVNSSNNIKHQSSLLLKSAVKILDLYVGTGD